jgi:hypothetical protein
MWRKFYMSFWKSNCLILTITLLTTGCQSTPPPENLWRSIGEEHREELVEWLTAGYQDVNGKCQKISFQIGSDERSIVINIDCGDQSHADGDSLRL